MNFKHFSENARVWVYQADRELTLTEIAWLTEQIPSFTNQWNAHGKPLDADGKVIGKHHLVFVVNPETAASGCSIDSSVRFVKSLETSLNISFFNRLRMLTQHQGDFEYVSFSELSLFLNRKVFNNNVQTLAEFESNWLVDVPKFLGN